MCASLDRRILVVDDDWMNVEVIQTLLQITGYGVQTARNGAQALTLAGEMLPDAVLLDIRMPGMDGYTVCRQLRQDAATTNIPVMLMSGLTDRETQALAKEAGAVALLDKTRISSVLLPQIRLLIGSPPPVG